MTILILILILILIGTLAAILYAATTLYVLLAVRRAPIDKRLDERELGRYGPRLHPRSRGGMVDAFQTGIFWRPG